VKAPDLKEAAVGRDREENLDQATEQMTEVVQKSYQTIAEGAVALQERNVRFSKSHYNPYYAVGTHWFSSYLCWPTPAYHTVSPTLAC